MGGRASQPDVEESSEDDLLGGDSTVNASAAVDSEPADAEHSREARQRQRPARRWGRALSLFFPPI